MFFGLGSFAPMNLKGVIPRRGAQWNTHYGRPLAVIVDHHHARAIVGGGGYRLRLCFQFDQRDAPWDGFAAG
jgi:hypothetical protein